MMLLNKLRLVLAILVLSVSFLFCMEFESDNFLDDSIKHSNIDSQVELIKKQ